LRELTIDIVCSSGDQEIVAGRLAMDHLELSRAIYDGVSIFDICDADSQGWEHVFSALFEPGTQAEWRDDFNLHEVINHVLYLYRAVFHPSLRNWQSFILRHVASIVGEDSVFVMPNDQTDLTNSELAKLGFRIVAGSGFRVRLNMFLDNAIDEGDVWELEVPASAQQYVEDRWP
jgi:hypothetical protein